MSHKIKFRLYREGDEEAVIELWRRTWKVVYPNSNFDVRLEWFRPHWKVHLVPKTTITVAEVRRSIVGFFTVDQRSGFMSHFIVAPEQRGRGIGGRFVKEVKQLSPNSVELEVRAYDTRTIRFYEKHGFVRVKYEVSASGGFVSLMRWQK